MRDVLVATSLRTPVGKAYKGSFAQTRPDDLGAAAVRGVLAADGLDIPRGLLPQ